MKQTLMIPLIILSFFFLFALVRSYLPKTMRSRLRLVVLPSYLIFLILITISFLIVEARLTWPEESVEENPPWPHHLEKTSDLEKLAPFKVNEYEGKLENKRIKIVTKHGAMYRKLYIPVLFIQDEALIDKVKVEHYVKNTFLNGVNLSDDFPLPTVEVNEGEIIIKEGSSQLEHEYRRIEDSFVVSQFKKEKKKTAYLDFEAGQTMLLLRLPPGVQVLSNQEEIELIHIE